MYVCVCVCVCVCAFYTQEDLIPEDVMLLDCWECMYLWVGTGANKAEKDQAPILAMVSTLGGFVAAQT